MTFTANGKCFILAFFILLFFPITLLGKIKDRYETEIPRQGANDYEKTHTTWVYPTKRHSIVIQGRQSQLTMLTLGRAKFSNPQGLSATSLGYEEDSNKRGRLINMTVYGCNTGMDALIYNRSMTSIGMYGVGLTGEEALDTPWDITSLPNGLVFVTDSGNRRVVKLRNIDADLVYQASFGQDSTVGLVNPRGIDVTHDGLLFVADAGSGRVLEFDTSGVLLQEFPGFDHPSALAAISEADPCFDRTSFTRPKAYFVVCDSGGKRLQKFTFEGDLLASGTLPDSLGPTAYISHIELDRHHCVAASDSANNRLLKFDPDLNLLTVWGEKGNDRGQFTGPTGVGIWRRRGRTFVAEQIGAQYLWVGTDVRGKPQVIYRPDMNALEVNMVLTEKARVQFEIQDEKGDIVHISEVIRDAGMASTIMPLVHGSRNRHLQEFISTPGDYATVLPAGEYTLIIRLRPLYSSYRYFQKILTESFTIPERLGPGTPPGQLNSGSVNR